MINVFCYTQNSHILFYGKIFKWDSLNCVLLLEKQSDQENEKNKGSLF